MDARHSFFVTCERGAEGALRRELVGLRMYAPTGARGGVSFSGTFTDGMRVCLLSRTAMRVLMQLAEFPAPDAEAFYQGVAAIDWREHLDAGHTFAVKAQTHASPGLDHAGFVALKAKDAIVDRLRDANGQRPSVDVNNPDLNVVVHLRNGLARLFLDLAGVPLHRRGYRVAMTEAPLKETLAAAVLALADVSVDEAFVDPMTGSGTFAIEQALRARHIAPGLHRKFGFERWPSQRHAGDLARLRADAADAVLAAAPAPILCRDLSPDAIAAARQNAAAAGVANDIRFEAAPINTLTPPASTGSLVTNPPYGQRLPTDLKTKKQDRYLPRQMARVFSLFWGWRVAVLAPEAGLARALGQPPDFTHRLYNGGIEVRLERFTLGSKA